MFCKYKADIPPLKPETTYWVECRTAAPTGRIGVSIPGMYQHVYANFEEFLTEWEIV